MVVTSNTKNKEKTKTLNKVIEREAFSEGFTLLKNFCKKSTENPEIISDFVTEFASENITKNIHRSLGENNIKTIKKFRELGCDPLELMQLLTCSKGIYHFWRKEKSLLGDMISALRTEFTAMELSSESELSRVEVDGVKFVKIESAKFYLSTSSGGKKRKFRDISSKLEDEVVDRFEELFSNLIDCYLKENPYAKFEIPNRTKVKVPYSSSSRSVYESSDLEVARWHICSFLNKFFVDLKKVEVNLSKKDPQTVFLALKQGKLTSEVDDKDDYLKLFTFDFKDLENIKLLEDYSWRGEKNIVVESLISTLNNNLKTLTSDLLTNEFSLENVLNKEIPLSILSDYQINKSLQDKQDINIYKLTLLRESSSSPEQFSRFMNILEKFIQDKFLE